ncbi:TPA: hypothetical protein RJN82_004685 [Pseudomonas aeruginosa]|uniref:hypothetical protein n=1 Tax=Pseudomonas aeruginosa TaxID=287 RepID=UPI00053E75D3|nr:hypothetical protein [Pseudomonas aeruginosa]MCO4019600.1 hypothetical protein [Pseudomonas aeruginosa]MCS7987353.1 hypothetical protein [Pseudomonas aeruginosa]MCS9097883.1 hypothetical protein [Pseudomonas aeruginosa]OPA54220.1 hypothetical protein BZY57_10130 [Pseudomonas aeruginosa]QDL06357.1 hypothetical protein IHMA87_06172 [Pseudomonas aeruginosa]
MMRIATLVLMMCLAAGSPAVLAAGQKTGVQLDPKPLADPIGKSAGATSTELTADLQKQAKNLQEDKVQRLKKQILSNMNRDRDLDRLAPYLGPDY